LGWLILFIQKYLTHEMQNPSTAEKHGGNVSGTVITGAFSSTGKYATRILLERAAEPVASGTWRQRREEVRVGGLRGILTNLNPRGRREARRL
jgi:hypothetical protein